MASGEEAIAAEEADRAFEPLRDFSHIVLAVSGGPDSLALLTLVAEWRARLGETVPATIVATVDHGLREQSQIEAQVVAEISAKLELPHTTLDWIGAKPTTGIPDAARKARYALLDDFASMWSAGQAVAVVTAHHQDDQAETFFMRLMRGGGVTALAAMSRQRRLASGSSVVLVRPLLDFSKSRLIATLARRGMSWFDDPTNENATFERVRVRQMLAEAQLSAPALSTAARRMRDAADGLQFAAEAFARTICLNTNRNIYACFDRAAFDAGPVILRHMVLKQLIACFGGMTGPPELSELEDLAQRFVNRAPFTVTLGGAVISAGSRYVRLWREAARIAVAPVTLRAGSSMNWDARFVVGYHGSLTDVRVKPLGTTETDLPHPAIPGTEDVPRAAVAGLPAFYAGEALLGVPILTNLNGIQTLGDGGRLTTTSISLTPPEWQLSS